VWDRMKVAWWRWTSLPLFCSWWKRYRLFFGEIH
jgi:hypothetical protein